LINLYARTVILKCNGLHYIKGYLRDIESVTGKSIKPLVFNHQVSNMKKKLVLTFVLLIIVSFGIPTISSASYIEFIETFDETFWLSDLHSHYANAYFDLTIEGGYGTGNEIIVSQGGVVIDSGPNPDEEGFDVNQFEIIEAYFKLDTNNHDSGEIINIFYFDDSTNETFSYGSYSGNEISVNLVKALINDGNLSVKITVTGGSVEIQYPTLILSTRAIPIPGAVWLLGSGLIGIVGIRRKFNK